MIDIVSGLFKVLFSRERGEIYNISNENSIASIAEVASVCAKIAGTNIIYQIPDVAETQGFSCPQDCILDNTKLKKMGWKAKYSLEEGLRETIDYLRKKEI